MPVAATSRSQRWLMRRLVRSPSELPEPQDEPSPALCCRRRRNSVTEFNIGSPLPIYDSDEDATTVDESGEMGVTPQRRERIILIQKPSSSRVLDMELPSPPKKPLRCVNIETVDNNERSKMLLRPTLLSQRGKSERHLSRSSLTTTPTKASVSSPPLFSSSFRNLLTRQPSSRRKLATKPPKSNNESIEPSQRRNSIARSDPRKIMRLSRTQSCRNERLHSSLDFFVKAPLHFNNVDDDDEDDNCHRFSIPLEQKTSYRNLLK